MARLLQLSLGVVELDTCAVRTACIQASSLMQPVRRFDSIVSSGTLGIQGPPARCIPQVGLMWWKNWHLQAHVRVCVLYNRQLDACHRPACKCSCCMHGQLR